MGPPVKPVPELICVTVPLPPPLPAGVPHVPSALKNKVDPPGGEEMVYEPHLKLPVLTTLLGNTPVYKRVFTSFNQDDAIVVPLTKVVELMCYSNPIFPLFSCKR